MGMIDMKEKVTKTLGEFLDRNRRRKNVIACNRQYI